MLTADTNAKSSNGGKAKETGTSATYRWMRGKRKWILCLGALFAAIIIVQPKLRRYAIERAFAGRVTKVSIDKFGELDLTVKWVFDRERLPWPLRFFCPQKIEANYYHNYLYESPMERASVVTDPTSYLRPSEPAPDYSSWAGYHPGGDWIDSDSTECTRRVSPDMCKGKTIRPVRSSDTLPFEIQLTIYSGYVEGSSVAHLIRSSPDWFRQMVAPFGISPHQGCTAIVVTIPCPPITIDPQKLLKEKTMSFP